MRHGTPGPQAHAADRLLKPPHGVSRWPSHTQPVSSQNSQRRVDIETQKNPTPLPHGGLMRAGGLRGVVLNSLGQLQVGSSRKHSCVLGAFKASQRVSEAEVAEGSGGTWKSSDRAHDYLY